MSPSELNKEIQQIIMTASSDKCTISMSDLNGSIEDYHEKLPPDQKYMTRCTVKAYGADDDGQKVADIGFMNAVFFEAEAVFMEETTFPMLCDALSSDADEMAAAITDRQGSLKPSICSPDQNILYVEGLFVAEWCRGHGAGRYLLDNMIPMLSHSLNLYPHVCILLPYPQIIDAYGTLRNMDGNTDVELPRLTRFYEKAGYQKIEGSECMYKKNAGPLDELFELLGV